MKSVVLFVAYKFHSDLASNQDVFHSNASLFSGLLVAQEFFKKDGEQIVDDSYLEDPNNVDMIHAQYVFDTMWLAMMFVTASLSLSGDIDTIRIAK